MTARMFNLASKRVRRGFTLIELMVVVGIAALIMTLAAPSFTSLIEMQKLRGVSAQLVTDMQFARSEAISRNTVVRIDFRVNSAMSCYSMYTAPLIQGSQGRCNCTLGPGNACTGLANRVEVRTLQVPVSTGVTIRPLPEQLRNSFGFDPTTGGIVSNPNDLGPTAIDDFRIDVYLDDARKLRTWLERSGRAAVCSPAGSGMTEASCGTLP